MLNYFLLVMQEEDGKPSSKRWLTLLFSLLMAGGFIASLFGVPVDVQLYDSLAWVVMAGLGIVASERVGSKWATRGSSTGNVG